VSTSKLRILRVTAHTANNTHTQSKYCRKSNGPTIVWLKSKRGWWTSNNITVHLLISGCSTVTMRGPPCARTSCPIRQDGSLRKTTKTRARGRRLRASDRSHLDGPAVFDCNVKPARRGFEIVHCARQLLADSDGRSGISSRASLYARAWPEVARGPRTAARKKLAAGVDRASVSPWFQTKI
jgi:hypothetical protein